MVRTKADGSGRKGNGIGCVKIKVNFNICSQISMKTASHFVPPTIPQAQAPANQTLKVKQQVYDQSDDLCVHVFSY